MDSFFDENPEFDNSGTNVEPLNLGWIRGKNNANGKKLVHKIGNLYYCGMVKYTSTKDGSKTTRCQDYKGGCCWTRTIKPVSQDAFPYFETENWKWAPLKRNQEFHTCGGIHKKELHDLQFRNHLRGELEKNRRVDYKQIRQSSGIDAKFGQEAQNLLQDEVVYQRAVNRKKTKLYGVMEHEIPNEFKKIETYNLETKSMVE